MLSEQEQRLAQGDRSVFVDVFAHHRPRLWQMVHFRLNGRIQGRVDPDDVLQDVYLAAESRLTHFIEGDFPSLFLWLRLVTKQTLSDVHRTHLGTAARSVTKETWQQSEEAAHATSLSLSRHFVAHMTSPSEAVARDELLIQFREAFDAMNQVDREIVALRSFEELTNQEVAQTLGISIKAASQRYIRALARLRSIMENIPGFIPPQT